MSASGWLGTMFEGLDDDGIPQAGRGFRSNGDGETAQP